MHARSFPSTGYLLLLTLLRENGESALKTHSATAIRLNEMYFGCEWKRSTFCAHASTQLFAYVMHATWFVIIKNDDVFFYYSRQYP